MSGSNHIPREVQQTAIAYFHTVIYVFTCWSCQDFNQFDCLHSEEGCQVTLDMEFMMAQEQINLPTPEMDLRDMDLKDMDLKDMGRLDLSSLDMASPVDMTPPMDMMPLDMSPNCQAVEICDGIDNDCDGTIDEAIPPVSPRIHLAELTALNEDCTHSKLVNSDCQLASHHYCRNLSCDYVGVGPLKAERSSVNPDDDSDDNKDVWLLCLPHHTVSEQTLDYRALEVLERRCDSQSDLHKLECRYAFQLYCQNELNQSGFGPIEADDQQATFGCMETTEFNPSYQELSEYAPHCDDDSDQAKLSCRRAIYQYCIAQGFIGGWGPIAKRERDRILVACVPHQ